MNYTEAIKHLTVKKTNYNDIESREMQSFPFYMVNRVLSMDIDYLPIINSIQVATHIYLDDEQHYRVLQALLPNKVGYTKYMKASTKSTKDTMVDTIIKAISKYYGCSISEASGYYDIIMLTDDKVDVISDILMSLELDVKEYKRIIKKIGKL